MKNRLIVTVSDIYSTKSYNLNKIVKKFIVWFTLAVVLLFISSFLIIDNLSSKVNELTIKSESLENKNELYNEQISKKIAYIEELGSELEDIEKIIGINQDDKVSLIQRATLAKLTSKQKTYMLKTIPSGCPLEKCAVTSPFGYRIHPVTNKKKFHNGLDLRAKRNTNIFATADGVVRYARNKNEGKFGRVVIIVHNFGFETLYGHLNSVDVKVGDIVQKGQIIAKSGNSGRTNGPHLHYEVRFASKVLDPKEFVSWSMTNYESIFEKQRRVEWESLVSLINNQNPTMGQQ